MRDSIRFGMRDSIRTWRRSRERLEAGMPPVEVAIVAGPKLVECPLGVVARTYLVRRRIPHKPEKSPELSLVRSNGTVLECA